MQPIDFRGYSGDCLIHGHLQLPAEVRLTDFLNASKSFAVQDMSLYPLDTGLAVKAGDHELPAAELWAVEPTDTGKTPWHADLRVATRSTRIEIEMGPYRICGTLHAVGKRGGSARKNRHRRQMIPLTEAQVTFTYMGHEITRESAAVIFNRARAQRIRRMGSRGAKPAVNPELSVPA